MLLDRVCVRLLQELGNEANSETFSFALDGLLRMLATQDPVHFEGMVRKYLEENGTVFAADGQELQFLSGLIDHCFIMSQIQKNRK